MPRRYLYTDQNNVKNAVALLPNVTGITTKEDEKEAENARMKAAVEALDGLTADQLKKLIEKAGAEIKKLVGKAKKKPGEDKSAAKKGAMAGAEVSAGDGGSDKAELPQAVPV
jgi:hypothetical protein